MSDLCEFCTAPVEPDCPWCNPWGDEFDDLKGEDDDG